jgi:competence protein ComEA
MRPDPPSFRQARALVAGLGISRAEAAALLLLALAAAAGVGLVWWAQVRPLGAPAQPAAAGEEPAAIVVAEGEVIVHVAGRVAAPGVHRLPGGARVGDALTAAGGALPDAWLDGLNLARPLVDGEQVHVPATPADPVGGADVEGTAGGGGPSSAGPSGVRPDGTVDLNHATAADLETLPGVGPVTAQRIVDHREQHGPFTSVGQLREVPGIGEKRFQPLAEPVAV